MNEQIFEQNVKPAFFDYDSYEIRPDAQTVLAQDASFLAAHPTLKIVVGGYCDDRGSAEYNLALGENRANAAKQALVNGGVSPDRVRTVSYGKEKQFCTQDRRSLLAAKSPCRLLARSVVPVGSGMKAKMVVDATAWPSTPLIRLLD